MSSLPRTLEPESMDDGNEVTEYQQMDFSAVNLAFVDDLFAGGPVGPNVLDLGCGPALIPVECCRRDLDLQVIAVDSSIEMLEAARIEIELGSVLGRIQLVHSDCKQLAEFDRDCADTVISNSVVHHLAEPRDLLEQAVRVARTGGRVFVRDLCRPTDEAALEALVARHAENESELGKQLLRQSLHAALTVQEVRELAEGIGISPQSIQKSSDRHWTLDWTKEVPRA